MPVDQADPVRKLIIDTDPGVDDAVAILLAFASPEIEVLGIVAVGGNVSVDTGQLNARKICELAGRPDIGVFAGASGSLGQSFSTEPNSHGPAGLGNASLPEPRMALRATHGVDFIVDTVMSNPPGAITFCALGPLTNLALAIVKQPALRSRLAQVVFMGGSAFRGGNVSAVAEFNIHQDPLAADIVMRSGIPIVMVPLDVTHKTLANGEVVERFAALGTRTGSAVADMINLYQRYDREKYGADGGPLHDPNVVGFLVAPALYRGKKCHVAVETASSLTEGMTVVDWWDIEMKTPNATVLVDVDAPAFFDLLYRRIGTLP